MKYGMRRQMYVLCMYARMYVCPYGNRLKARPVDQMGVYVWTCNRVDHRGKRYCIPGGFGNNQICFFPHFSSGHAGFLCALIVAAFAQAVTMDTRFQVGLYTLTIHLSYPCVFVYVHVYEWGFPVGKIMYEKLCRCCSGQDWHPCTVFL